MTFPKWVVSTARYVPIVLCFSIVLTAFGFSLYRLFTHESIIIRHVSFNSLLFGVVLLALYCLIPLLKWSFSSSKE